MDIKVKDLQDTQTVTTSNQIMVLTNDTNNLVENITIGDLVNNTISADLDNLVEQGTDDKFFVKNTVGDLTTLTTTDKTTAVAAINEVKSDLGTTDTTIGNLADLDTTDKDSVVDAINELNSIINPTLQYNAMNNSKAMRTGTLSSDSTIYPDVVSYAHSTYDSSKFTATGTPIVTSDGIADGFSSSNYLGITVPKFGTNFVFKTNIITGDDVITNNQYLIEDTYFRLWFTYISSGSYFVPTIRIYDGSNEFYLREYDNMYTLAANSEYDIEVGFNSNTQAVYIKVWDGTGALIGNTQATATNNINLSALSSLSVSIGNRGGFNAFDGAVNLKAIEFFADNECVFNGNNRNVDKLIADDYYIVGTPTIVNGVMSGGSDSNYIEYRTLEFTQDDLFEITTPVITPTTNNVTNDGIVKQASGSNTNGFVISLQNTGKILCLLQAPSFTDITRFTIDYTAGNQYQFKWVHPQTGVYEAYYKINNGEWTLGHRVTGNTLTFDTSSKYLQYGRNATDAILNLNGAYATVNGITYTPCLYIPFNWSKTGSKIVNVTERANVQSMAHQFGYAPYYVLDEINRTFALPQTELYGLINRAGNDFGKPDFSTGVTITAPYTVAEGGWIYVDCEGFANSASLVCKINDIQVGRFQVDASSPSATTLLIPVQIGDIFSVITSNFQVATQVIYKFYKNKGV